MKLLMRKYLKGSLLMAAASIALAGCGGSGGGENSTYEFPVGVAYTFDLGPASSATDPNVNLERHFIVYFVASQNFQAYVLVNGIQYTAIYTIIGDGKTNFDLDVSWRSYSAIDGETNSSNNSNITLQKTYPQMVNLKGVTITEGINAQGTVSEWTMNSMVTEQISEAVREVTYSGVNGRIIRSN